MTEKLFGKDEITYYVGEVEAKGEGSNKASVWIVAYERHFNFAEMIVSETIRALVDGEYFKETYIFDHKTDTLVCYDSNGSEISRTEFTCDGKFPDLKSCSYNFEGQKYRMVGNDSYHDGQIMEFNSLNVELSNNRTVHVRGKLPQATKKVFEQKIKEIKESTGVNVS